MGPCFRRDDEELGGAAPQQLVIPRHRVSPPASPMTGSSGYPVRRGLSTPSLTPRNTGSPAFAGDDDRGVLRFVALLLAMTMSQDYALRDRNVTYPTGHFANSLSSPFRKNISLFPKPKSVVLFAPSRSSEGRCATSRTRSGMRWTRRRA